MGEVISTILVSAVRFYQMTFSRVLGNRCRFHPTCSQYMIEAINLKGPAAGLWLGVKRIARCHPFNPGGCDPVK